MRVWRLIGVAGKPSHFKADPAPDIIVKRAIRPSLEIGEEVAVVPLLEHTEKIEMIQARCPHQYGDGSSAVGSSSAGLEIDCSICGKDWDYE